MAKPRIVRDGTPAQKRAGRAARCCPPPQRARHESVAARIAAQRAIERMSARPVIRYCEDCGAPCVDAKGAPYRRIRCACGQLLCRECRRYQGRAA